jgi:hypothetical protein
MGTQQSEQPAVSGSGKGPEGWFSRTRATVSGACVPGAR